MTLFMLHPCPQEGGGVGSEYWAIYEPLCRATHMAYALYTYVCMYMPDNNNNNKKVKELASRY